MPVVNSEDSDAVSTETPPSCATRPRFKLSTELPCLFILFGVSLSNGVTSNLLLYRTCLNDLKYNASTCDLLVTKNKTAEARDLESEVESRVTILLMTMALYSGVIPAILSVFLGSWSDKHGRKPLVVWPLFGLLITSVLAIIYTSIPTLGAWWYIFCIIPFSLFGGFTTFSLGSNLLITDLTDDKNRSFRLAVLQGCFFLGIVLGTIASSYVYEAIGYFYLFSLTSAIYFISFFYTLFIIKETLEEPQKARLKDLFNLETLKDMATTCSKSRPPSVGAILILLISAYGISMICINGIGNIEYLFTREKFQWLLRDYSIFSAVNVISIIFGILFGMVFFQKVCKMSDGVLLILAYISSISEAVLKGLAVQPWQLYIAATTAMLGGLTIPLIRSQVAKVVPKDEIGKMFSLISCVEAILPVFAPTLFSTIYYKTLAVFPGAIYMVSASLLTISFILVTAAEILHRKKQIPYLVLDEDVFSSQEATSSSSSSA